MTLADILKALSGAGKWSLADMIKFIKNSTKKPLPPHRWKVTADGTNLGNVVKHHDLGLNAPILWGNWIWEAEGKTTNLRIEAMPGSKNVWTTVTTEVEGTEPDSESYESKLAFTSGGEGNIFSAWLIVKIKEKDGTREFRLAGKIT